jgi:hypothetical protein
LVRRAARSTHSPEIFGNFARGDKLRENGNITAVET